MTSPVLPPLRSSSAPQEHPSIEIGRIIGVHGIKGWLKVRSLSDFPERLTQAGPRWLQRPGQEPIPVRLEQGQWNASKNFFLVKLAQCQDRTQAETWIGSTLFIDLLERPQLQEDEYYLPDLVGVAVLRQSDRSPLGTISAVLHTGSQDLLEIETRQGVVLLPFVKALVPVVDLPQRQIWVDPPLGLFATD